MTRFQSMKLRRGNLVFVTCNVVCIKIVNEKLVVYRLALRIFIGTPKILFYTPNIL